LAPSAARLAPHVKLLPDAMFCGTTVRAAQNDP